MTASLSLMRANPFEVSGSRFQNVEVKKETTKNAIFQDHKCESKVFGVGKIMLLK